MLAVFCAGDKRKRSDIPVIAVPGSIRPASALGCAKGWRLPRRTTVPTPVELGPADGDAAAPDGRHKADPAASAPRTMGVTTKLRLV